MRKQLLGCLVPLLAMVMVASAADMTGKGVAASAALQKLEVTHSQDGLRVEFKATMGVLAPRLTTLDSPARIVVDLPNTVMATAQSHISVGRDGVEDVRIGMDGQTPPTTRVVVDLAASCLHELVAAPNGGFVLVIHDAALAHRSAAPAGKVSATNSSPSAASPALERVASDGSGSRHSGNHYSGSRRSGIHGRAGFGFGGESREANGLCFRRTQVFGEGRQS